MYYGYLITLSIDCNLTSQTLKKCSQKVSISKAGTCIIGLKTYLLSHRSIKVNFGQKDWILKIYDIIIISQKDWIWTTQVVFSFAFNSNKGKKDRFDPVFFYLKVVKSLIE